MKKGIVKKVITNIAIATLPIAMSFSIASCNIPVQLNVTEDITSPSSVYNEVVETSPNTEIQNNQTIGGDTQDNQTTAGEIQDATQNSKQLDYASMEQIYSLMKDLNADNSYLRTYQNFHDITKPDVFNVLNHNNGEPIYIVIPNTYDENSKEIVKKSLDIVMGMISQVNDKYASYEIVDSIPQGKAYIEYKVGDIHFEGLTGLDFDYQTIRSESGSILLDDNLINNEKKQNNLLYSLCHELLHIFGFADVYNQAESKFEGQEYAKTFMKGTYSIGTTQDFVPITPNDYKLLLSLYAPACYNQDEYNAMLDKITNLSNEYESEYYTHIVDFVESKMGQYQVGKFSDKFVVGFDDFLNTGKKMAVKVEGDKYKLFAKDENGNQIEVCEGKVFISGDGIILQDLKIENTFIRNLGGAYFTGDIALGCGVKEGEVKIFACNYSQTMFSKAVAVSGFEHLQENSLGY